MVNHPNRSRKALRVFNGCFDGVTEFIVATTSQKRAAELFDVSLNAMRNYGHETGNDQEVALATSKPGTVFSKPACDFHAPYVEGRIWYRRGQPWPPQA